MFLSLFAQAQAPEGLAAWQKKYNLLHLYLILLCFLLLLSSSRQAASKQSAHPLTPFFFLAWLEKKTRSSQTFKTHKSISQQVSNIFEKFILIRRA